jgi:hypothetical protein
MTVTEIKEVSGLNPSTMRAWIRKYEVVPVKRLFGVKQSRMEIKKEDFLRFAEERLGYHGEDLAQLRARVDALPERPARAPRRSGPPKSEA